MTPAADVRYAVETLGLSIVCATCAKYWKAREAGVPDNKCFAVGKCGSPIVGDSFSQYEGEIPDLSRWCFVCGQDADFGVRPSNNMRVVGVCKKHVKHLHNLVPTEKNGEGVILLHHEGSFVVLEDVLKPPKLTLVQEMVKTEMEWGKKFG